MNDQNSPENLPELSAGAIERIETAVFAEIAQERTPTRRPAERAGIRRRRWLTASGIAAAFVVGILVTPPIMGLVDGGGAMSTAVGEYTTTDESVAQDGARAPERGAEVAPGVVPGAGASSSEAESGREIIATATATVRVDDIADATDAVSALAEEHGGFVESTNIGRSGVVTDPAMPVPTESGWISIRVPSADLPAVMDALGDSGEVLSSSISKQDVTSTAIDLRARVEATRASVQRLTELMSQSGSVSELIEAEVALTDRQAQLESYEQQLAALEDQVAMSTLQVELTRSAAPTKADPAGFGDGLLAGWNGLIVSLNALVIAFGFLLPWLGVAAVVLLLLWLIRRARHARKNADHARAVED